MNRVIVAFVLLFSLSAQAYETRTRDLIVPIDIKNMTIINDGEGWRLHYAKPDLEKQMSNIAASHKAQNRWVMDVAVSGVFRYPKFAGDDPTFTVEAIEADSRSQDYF